MGQTEEIKSKLDIVEVIREYVPVKAVGANFRALCPFHNEKTPSFMISPEKQIWHCFGCGRGGDVFAFVMEKEGLGFMEALRLLAPKAGVVLKYENPETYSQRNRLLDILELAGKYYAHILTTPAGQNAKEYLLNRGLSPETIIDWQLGYSPDAWDNLYQFLKQRPLSGQKYTDEEIFLAGLITKKDSSAGGGRGYYDRFRDRIMFPIFDVNNNLIAFTARVNPAKEKTEKMGKYINSPQTQIYDKSRVLFALNKAKIAIRQADSAIVVEGQMDAISCHQHGFENVVASSGTALTLEQIKLLKRYTNNIVFALDSDSAGMMAKEKGGDLVNSRRDKIVAGKDEQGQKKLYLQDDLTAELNIFIIEIKGAKDPDECLKNNPDDFQEAIKNKKLLTQYFFDNVFFDFDPEDVVAKKRAIEAFLLKLERVNSKVEEDNWLKKLSEITGVRENILREDLEKRKDRYLESKKKTAGGESADGKSITSGLAVEISRADKLAELLLALLVKFPEFINYNISDLEPEFVSGAALSRFYKSLIIYYNKAASLDYEDFRRYLEEQEDGSEKLLDKLTLLSEKDFYNYELNQVKAEIINIIAELKKYGRQKKIQKLQKAIARAEKEENQDELTALMNELKNLMSLN